MTCELMAREGMAFTAAWMRGEGDIISDNKRYDTLHRERNKGQVLKREGRVRKVI